MNQTTSNQAMVGEVRVHETLDQTGWTSKRRDFLRMLGYGTGAAALGPILAACGSSNAQSPAEALRAELMKDEAFWTGVQGMFVLNPAKTFMNIGTAGSMPTTVLDTFPH